MAEEEDRLIQEAQEEFEEIERLRKLDEAERVMAEAEKYLNSQKEEKNFNEFKVRSFERKEMIVDVIVVDSSTSGEKGEEDEGESGSESEEEEAENEKEEVKSDNSCLGYISTLGVLFIALFSFFVFYPPKYNTDLLWLGFANNCCSIYHNVTRCILNVTCKSRLDLWIYSMNNTINYFNKCCYIYGSYDTWLFFAERYCDPFCLRPKLL